MLTPWKESYDQPREHIKKQFPVLQVDSLPLHIRGAPNNMQYVVINNTVKHLKCSSQCLAHRTKQNVGKTGGGDCLWLHPGI